MTAMNLNRAVRGPVTAVPIVAGKGVRLTADVQNNRWVVEADETTLWEKSSSQSLITSCTLSEDYHNFEKLKVYIINNDLQTSCVEMITANQGSNFSVHTLYCNGTNTMWVKDSTFTLNNTSIAVLGAVNYQITTGINTVTHSATGNNYLLKVVGVNRIASN